jgi:pimeloyl-ACP methyl ester carboxylesterase
MNPIITESGFSYIESGEGEPLVLLHGLFGGLSNWDSVIEAFSKKYRVIIPTLPIYTMPIPEASLDSLLVFLEDFIAFKKLSQINLIGNSLGGHSGLLYALKHQDNLKTMCLTGSSGLFEDSMGASYPKRGNYEFVQERVRHTFYNPAVATKELVDEVFEVTRSIPTCQRMVRIARSAQRHNLSTELHQITIPVCLIWGLNDTITPVSVAYEFNRLLQNAELNFIDYCSHAPMMEHPEKFNEILMGFLQRKINEPALITE